MTSYALRYRDVVNTLTWIDIASLMVSRRLIANSAGGSLNDNVVTCTDIHHTTYKPRLQT